jgi:hypothetical protein
MRKVFFLRLGDADTLVRRPLATGSTHARNRLSTYKNRYYVCTETHVYAERNLLG